MGSQIECNARWGKIESRGVAHLETSQLIFRGDFRAAIDFVDIQAIRSVDGVLILETPGRTLELDLGPKAERWKDKILNPPSLTDKLGVKAGQTIAVVGTVDVSFLDSVDDVSKDNVDGERKFDIVFYAAASESDLSRVSEMRRALAPKGCLWIVFPKGKMATLKDVTIIDSGRRAGLVDVKVVAFSSTHTALKFVQPAKTHE